MRPLFRDSIAETREDFLNIVASAPVTFFEVYFESPSTEIESLFEIMGSEYPLFRFNMKSHSVQARARFCQLDDLTRTAYSIPSEALELPLPYFSSFVRPFGKTRLAWTSGEVHALIKRTLDEEKIAKKVP
jgi:hypothetical protein